MGGGGGGIYILNVSAEKRSIVLHNCAVHNLPYEGLFNINQSMYLYCHVLSKIYMHME